MIFKVGSPKLSGALCEQLRIGHSIDQVVPGFPFSSQWDRRAEAKLSQARALRGPPGCESLLWEWEGRAGDLGEMKQLQVLSRLSEPRAPEL